MRNGNMYHESIVESLLPTLKLVKSQKACPSPVELYHDEDSNLYFEKFLSTQIREGYYVILDIKNPSEWEK